MSQFESALSPLLIIKMKPYILMSALITRHRVKLPSSAAAGLDVSKACAGRPKNSP